MILKAMMKRSGGVSWQHPAVTIASPLIDRVDLFDRGRHGLSSLPRWSMRIRSNGISDQFGGHRFALAGGDSLHMLLAHAGLRSGDKLLDVGCGVGRLAHALRRMHMDVEYVGTDVDSVAIKAARDSLPGYEFRLIDVKNDLYNPSGSQGPNSAFPFDDETSTIVTLFSVFTHFPPDDVAAYMREIGRVTTESARCLMTVFLAGIGEERGGRRFPYHVGPHFVSVEDNPLKAVAYPLGFLDTSFAEVGFRRSFEPLLGAWRQNNGHVDVPIGQDVLVYSRS